VAWVQGVAVVKERVRAGGKLSGEAVRLKRSNESSPPTNTHQIYSVPICDTPNEVFPTSRRSQNHPVATDRPVIRINEYGGYQ
jgi:hypothetical protein